MADLGDQLKIALELNNALKEQQKILATNLSLMGKQAQASQQMCASLDCSGLKNMEKAAVGLSDALQEGASKSKEGFGGLNDVIEQTADGLGSIGKKAAALAVLTSFVKGMRAGFDLVNGAIVGIVKGVFGLGKALFKLTRIILAVPFDFLSNLIQYANAQSISPFARKMEEVRDLMGDISKGPGRDLIETTNSITKAFSKNSAVSASQIYGYGREGQAAQLQEAMELAKAMGPMYETLSEKYKEAGGEIVKIGKGMGLSIEQTGKLAVHLEQSGKDFKETTLEIAHYAQHMADTFNISSVGIMRDVTEMTLDMEHFGGMSTEAMSALSTQMRRTGLQMKTLQGIVDHFDNFENAAKSAAVLRRQFGMVIDPVKMNTMDAAQKQEYLRKAFEKTGRTFEKMHRTEQLALGATLKMSSAELQALLGKGNAGKKLSDAEKEAAKARELQIDQNKIMYDLTKNIKKLLQEPPKHNSFWHAFLSGFEKGVTYTAEMQSVIWNLRGALNQVYWAGRQVGEYFVKYFPGVKDILSSIADFFSPGKMGKSMSIVTAAFKEFFISIKDPSKIGSAIDKFFNSITTAFDNFMTGDGAKFGGAVDTFMTVLGNIAIRVAAKGIELAGSLIKGLAEGIKQIAGISGGDVGEAADSVGNGFMARFGDSFRALGDTITEKFWPALEAAWPIFSTAMGKLWDKVSAWFSDPAVKKKLSDGFRAVWDWLAETFGPVVQEMWEKHKGKVYAALAVYVGAGMVSGLLNALGTAILTTFGPQLATMLMTGLSSAVTTTATALGIGAGAVWAGVVALAISMVNGIRRAFEEAWTSLIDGDSLSTGISKMLMGFAGGVTEALTLGMFDYDNMMDTVFGGTRVAERLLEEQAVIEKQAINKFIKETSEQRDKLAKHMEAQELADFEARQKAIIAAQATFAEQLKESTGAMFDSDVQMTFSKEQIAAGVHQDMQMAIRSILTAEEQKLLTYENGVLTIDDDIYQNKREALEKAIAGLGGKEAYANKLKSLEEAAAKKTVEVAGSTSGFMETVQGYINNTGASVPPMLARVVEEEFDEISRLSAEEAAKVTRLEAAKNTLDKMKELKEVPTELEATRKSFAGLKPEKIEKDVKSVFDSIADVTKYLAEATKRPELNKPTSVISDSVIKNFEGVKSAREAVDAIVGKQTTGAKTVNLRKANITAAVDAIGEIGGKMKGIATSDIQAAAIGANVNVLKIAQSVETIVGKDGIFDKRVDGLSTKISGSKKAVTELNNLAKELQKTPELVKALNIGDKMSVTDEISVSMKSAQITMHVTVNVDAKKFAQNLLEVDLDDKDGQTTTLVTKQMIEQPS